MKVRLNKTCHVTLKIVIFRGSLHVGLFTTGITPTSRLQDKRTLLTPGASIARAQKPDSLRRQCPCSCAIVRATCWSIDQRLPPTSCHSSGTAYARWRINFTSHKPSSCTHEVPTAGTEQSLLVATFKIRFCPTLCKIFQ